MVDGPNFQQRHGLAPSAEGRDPYSVIVPPGGNLYTYTTSMDPQRASAKRENEPISSFQKEFNLVLGANQKIEFIAFIEGLRLSKFKESILKKRPRAWRMLTSGLTRTSGFRRLKRGRKRGMESAQRRIPAGGVKIQRGEASWTISGCPIELIPGPLCPGGVPSPMSRGIRGRKRRQRTGKLSISSPLNASTRNVFMEIQDKRMLPRPPTQKNPQTKRDMRYIRMGAIGYAKGRSGGGGLPVLCGSALQTHQIEEEDLLKAEGGSHPGRGYKVVEFLDAFMGYHHIFMAEEDVEKTAFITKLFLAPRPRKMRSASPEGSWPCSGSYPELGFRAYPSLRLSRRRRSLSGSRILYIVVSVFALSIVLIREEAKVQRLVYYISRVMKRAETRYPQMEKLVYALVVAV
ncbi:hypothetical protein LIER_23217 [Lithospermum erythrorhizon]|uniref:Reverse transcriptase RNase H-like domain-containing protein n=1 Tax=Lithospermum erythrorhizon TaxID=34254 RepID=A0AAV3QWL8_LITER